MTPDLNRDRLSHNPNPQQTAEIGQRVAEPHHAVVRANEWGEFVQFSDEDWRWLPQHLGAMTAAEMRAIADELDRLNGISNAPTP